MVLVENSLIFFDQLVIRKLSELLGGAEVVKNAVRLWTACGEKECWTFIFSSSLIAVKCNNYSFRVC